MTRWLALAHRARHGLMSRGRNVFYRALGVDIRGYVWMRSIEIPRNWSDITLEADVALDRGVVLQCSGAPRKDKLYIGSGTYVNRYTVLTAHDRVRIGRDCMIGPFCYFTDANHGMASGASVKSQPMTTAPVTIEDEAWIGAHVTVLPGVRIGRGAVIGAGSVVTSDIPAGSVAVGSPARVTRLRSTVVSAVV